MSDYFVLCSIECIQFVFSFCSIQKYLEMLLVSLTSVCKMRSFGAGLYFRAILQIYYRFKWLSIYIGNAFVACGYGICSRCQADKKQA